MVARLASLIAVVAVAFIAWSCASPKKPATTQIAADKAVAPIPMPSLAATRPADYPGIHNAVAFHEGFVSGSVPEGDEGFDTLRAMGIKTIISVDGSEPEVDRASARGMKYVHLPIGYNGFDEKRKLELVRATRDAMKDGPVYIHCHHGKHRSAGAAATVAASLGWSTPDESVGRMKVSGTSPNYKGLYACAVGSAPVEQSTIDAVPANFPSISKPAGFVKAMVEVDLVFDHLKAIEKAGWTVPANHPDLVPAAEAGRLADLYRNSLETEYAEARPAEFAAILKKSHAEAQLLEDLIVEGKSEPAKLSAQFKLVAASCVDCHRKYRD